MKIYFDGIIYGWQKGGGVHRYFTELMSRLEGKVDVNLIMPEPSYDASFSVGIKKIFVFGGSFHASARYFSLVRKLMSLVNKIMFNIFFSKIKKGIFYSTYYTTYNSLKIPQVLIVHDLTHERFPEYFQSAGSKRFIKQKKKCIDRADAIICISESTKKFLCEKYNVPEKKISIIFHGIDKNFNLDYSSALANAMKNKYKLDKPFLLFVGQRGTYKNFNFLVSAFAAWSHNNEFDLVVAGGNAVNDEEIKLISHLGLDNKIKFLGFVSDDELKTLYCSTSAFIFPSLDEGFGFPNLEAICCGARVLASDLPVFKETARNTPIYFNPHEINSLVSALDEAISCPKDNRDELIRNSEKVRAEFSWDKCVSETTAVFEEVQKNWTKDLQ